jgi:tetratricopeptide (TPR) repeat protein
LDDAAVRKLGEGGKLNTDDLTLLEYHAPRSLLDHTIGANRELIDKLRNGPLAESLDELRHRPLPKNLDPREIQRALEAGAITTLDLNDFTGAREYVEALKLQPESAARYIAEGRLDFAHRDLPKAKSSFENSLRLDPDSLEAMHWLALTEHQMGNDISAQARVDDMLKRNPRFLPALNDRLQFAMERKDNRAALQTQLTRIAVMEDPPANEYCALGGLWSQESNLSEAESVLVKGLLKDPDSFACHFELGRLYAQSGRYAQARQNFEWVVRFYPTANAETYRILAGICSSLGDSKSARSTLRKGRRFFPDDPRLLATTVKSPT